MERDIQQTKAIGHAPVGIFVLDRNGLCTDVNDAGSSILGYERRELLGADLHALTQSRHADGSAYERVSCPFLQAALTGSTLDGATDTFWTKQGEQIQVSASAMPLGGGGAVITLQDQSEQLRIREQLSNVEHEQTEILRQRDAAARIERELAEEKALHQRDLNAATERAAADQLRTQQRLAEDRLLQSEKLAAVGRLAASISHEINNPLEAVTNLLYLVRHDVSLSAQACSYVEQAEAELSRVSQIVSETLRFQRSGRAPVEISPDKMVGSVLSLHQGRLHHRRITIDQNHRRPTPFRCAEGDVRQILNNLVGNAIDAMSKAGGQLTIRTTPARDVHTGQRGLRITVADSGHGIKPEAAARIFEPFYTTKGTSGSGLGLWISATLARRHGGYLSVRSRTEERGGPSGTVFSLFLPESAIEQKMAMEDDSKAKAA